MFQILARIVAAALSVAPQTYAVAVHADGRAEIESPGTGNTSKLDLDGPPSSACESVGGENLASNRVAVIAVEPATPYETFLRTANRLQDCGIFRIDLERRAPGEAATGPVIPMWQQPLIWPGPQPSALCPNTGDVIDRCIAFVTLTGAGDIWVIVGSHQAKRSSLNSVCQDVRQALKTHGLPSRRVFIRADRGVPFASYLDVAIRLHNDGLTDLGVLNEEV